MSTEKDCHSSQSSNEIIYESFDELDDELDELFKEFNKDLNSYNAMKHIYDIENESYKNKPLYEFASKDHEVWRRIKRLVKDYIQSDENRRLKKNRLISFEDIIEIDSKYDYDALKNEIRKYKKIVLNKVLIYERSSMKKNLHYPGNYSNIRGKYKYFENSTKREIEIFNSSLLKSNNLSRLITYLYSYKKIPIEDIAELFDCSTRTIKKIRNHTDKTYTMTKTKRIWEKHLLSS